MLFNKRKKTIITLGIGQAPQGVDAPPARRTDAPQAEPAKAPPEPGLPLRAEEPAAPPVAIAEKPAPVPRPEATPAVVPVHPAPPAAVPADAPAPESVETAAPPQPRAEMSAVQAEDIPQQGLEAPPAELEIQAEGVPGETTGFIQCPFCLKNSRVGLTHCESCGNLIESTRLPAEPEPEAAVPEPAAPVASGAALVERPDQADTHRLAHHPVPQILKETTLFTPAMLRLQPEQGQTGEKIYNLNIGDSTIGRGIDNTLAFPDEEFISRRHCSIGYHKYQYVLKDYDSANGTYVNDVRIRETILRDGDCVQIGSMRFIFDDPMERIKKKKAAAGED
ncbi:MAG TPA: FHA domain-containing protein [Acidobacteriota bacterium]|nr:FHA domain-containing protein [Acidobacteriota bacterium]HOB51094.1 FHA domain-containing protein [Acidobacteriota bacterium]HQM63595.1 FHA domain-containing protein [Acidobacteriota bacterium]